MVRTRIAPTPSGWLHTGNLYSFILTWLIARSRGGTVRLRIDDLDAARCRTEYLEDIFRSLEWIGLVPDEGPSGVEDFKQHHSQQLRLELYHALLSELQQAGLVYGCTCSRRQIRDANPAGIYTGVCRAYPKPLEAHDTAWRVSLPQPCNITWQDAMTGHTTVALPEAMGDFVVRTRQGIPAYQVASVCDDILYDINAVVRGRDLTYSTAAQLWLAAVTGRTAFAGIRWWHHPLLLDRQGDKLSKSQPVQGASPVALQGLSLAYLFNGFAAWLGLPAGNYHALSDLLEAYLASGKNG